ncbi:MAG: hypothetical protein A2Y34_15315 [Spirochaetes bacterium GWC1_27_15]|nr:MAG: hypothetical protein A2Y34_15315 [Spirochaetes bacterium GWC1_27_15]
MVPNDTVSKYKTNLKIILNIFEKLKIIAEDKQKNILSQKWDEVYIISEEHQKINQDFDKIMKDFGDFKTSVAINDTEIKNLKSQLKERVMEYKEMENLNIKLLNDALFFAKQKVEKIFNKKGKDTYTKDLKKTTALWEDTAIIFDKFI